MHLKKNQTLDKPVHQHLLRGNYTIAANANTISSPILAARKITMCFVIFFMSSLVPFLDPFLLYFSLSNVKSEQQR